MKHNIPGSKNPGTGNSAVGHITLNLSSTYSHHLSFDYIIDDEQRLSAEDSLFEKISQHRFVLSDSVLGDDLSHSCAIGLLPVACSRWSIMLFTIALTIRCRCWTEAMFITFLFFLWKHFHVFTLRSTNTLQFKICKYTSLV